MKKTKKQKRIEKVLGAEKKHPDETNKIREKDWEPLRSDFNNSSKVFSETLEPIQKPKLVISSWLKGFFAIMGLAVLLTIYGSVEEATLRVEKQGEFKALITRSTPRILKCFDLRWDSPVVYCTKNHYHREFEVAWMIAGRPIEQCEWSDGHQTWRFK